MLTSVGFDFSNCPLLTINSCRSLNRVQTLKIINFDNCSGIDDAALQPLVTIAANLEVLSLAGLTGITDVGLKSLADTCQSLKVLNLSRCSQVSSEILFAFTKTNRRMHTLHMSALGQLTDEGLSALCLHLSPDFMTNIDLSFCRDVTDFGLITISEVCPKLKYLNICSVSRVTDLGVQRLLSNCWFLEDLNMEDIFLTDEKCFWFNSAFDGRSAANELMLKSLIHLNLKDCVNLSDRGIVGLSERCRKIESLTLSGCEKLTNQALLAMSQTCGYQIPLCDSIKKLDLSYCARIDAHSGLLPLLPLCACLESLNLSGITSVDDAFIHQLCLVCKTVQHFVLQKCVQLTNLSLCSMSDFLWIESLDISSCVKINDDGIEVLASACSGLLSLCVRKLNKLTARGLNAISRNCVCLESLDVRDCLNVTEQAVHDVQHQHRLTKILSSYDAPKVSVKQQSTARGAPPAPGMRSKLKAAKNSVKLRKNK
jgi:hypothetical protein